MSKPFLLLSNEEIETWIGYFIAVNISINNSGVQSQTKQAKVQCCLNCIAECTL